MFNKYGSKCLQKAHLLRAGTRKQERCLVLPQVGTLTWSHSIFFATQHMSAHDCESAMIIGMLDKY